jgi:lipopolysaccharide export system protein LptC
MNYRKSTAGLSILVGLLAFIVWQLQPEKKQKKSSALNSDYRLMDFQMKAFNEQGQASFSLAAPLLERDSTGKTVIVSKPVFSFPGEANEVWLAHSDSAWVSDKARIVKLQDNVKIIGPPSQSGQQLELSTSQLSIFPKQNRIIGDDWVTIMHGNSILKGLGLEADIKQHRVQLLTKVQAHYVVKTL